MNSQSWYARFNSEVSYLNDVEALDRDRESTNPQHDQRSLRPHPINVFSILKNISNKYIDGWEQYEEYIHKGWTKYSIRLEVYWERTKSNRERKGK